MTNNLFCPSKIWDNERLPPLRVKTSIAFFPHQLFPQQRTRHRQGGGFWTSKCVHVSTNRLKEPIFNRARSNISDIRWIFPNSITATAPDDPNPMSCHPFALLDPTNDPRSVLDSKKLNVDLDKSLARQSECISAANCTSWFQLEPFCIISGGRQQKIRLSRWAYWNWSI